MLHNWWRKWGKEVTWMKAMGLCPVQYGTDRTCKGFAVTQLNFESMELRDNKM